MSEDFAPSPRGSKRRRISYKADATDRTAVDHATAPSPVRAARKPNRTQNRVGSTNLQNESFEDSAYGSKEEGLTEIEARPGKNLRLSKTGTDHIDDAHEHNHDETIEVQPRSSGRERRKPRRFSVSPEPVVSTKTRAKKALPLTASANSEVSKSPTVKIPKGILTPSKSIRNQTKKTVIFEQKGMDIEEQLGFRDIGNTKPKQSQPVLEENITISEAAEKARNSQVGRKKKSLPSSTPSAEAVAVNDEEPVDLIFDQVIESARTDELALDTHDKRPQVYSLNEDPALLKVKITVLSRLTSAASRTKFSVPLHLQPQYTSLHDLLTSTIATGESNSLLLLGSRGSGKSSLVQTALDELRKEHDNDFHVVKLNGFFQTDDRLALREIWRQLGREMNISEDETDGVGSYADTMASLLSLLSHPDEFLDDEARASDGNERSGVSKSIVFVLDEFDLFTTHPRQTLLYNLFDIAQSRKAPIAVIGCSTRMDVVECLEKRVKSRFSHRWLHIPNSKSLEGFEQVAQSVLCVDETKTEAGGILTKEDDKARRMWNHYIQTEFLKLSDVQDHIRRIYYTTKALPDLWTALYALIAVAQPSVTSIDSRVTAFDHPDVTQPHHLALLPDLPTLQMSLVIAAARLDTIHNLAAVNLNLVYDHYAELISRSKLQQTASGAIAVGAGLRQWTLDMAKNAWEDLCSSSLIVPAAGASFLGGKEGGFVESAGGEGAGVTMWRVDVTLDDLAWALREKRSIGGTMAGVADSLVKWCTQI